MGATRGRRRRRGLACRAAEARRRRWSRRERGAALLEFALCAPVLATLGFGVADLGRAYAVAERARAAAREAAFYAASHPGQLHNVTGTACSGPANATWRGSNAGSGSFTFTFSPDLANPATDCNPSPLPAGLGPGQPLRVTATANLPLLTPFVGQIIGNTLTVSATVCVDVAGPPSTVPCS